MDASTLAPCLKSCPNCCEVNPQYDSMAMAEAIRSVFPDAVPSYAHLDGRSTMPSWNSGDFKTEPQGAVKTAGRNGPSSCSGGC